MAKKKTTISNYIEENAFTHINERGDTIYKVNKGAKIKLVNDSVFIRINGSSENLYTVKIKNYQNSNISTSCTCKYDWGGICKHEVAALLILEKYLNGNTQTSVDSKKNKTEKTPILRNSNELYYIDDYRNITNKLVFENTNSKEYKNEEKYYYQEKIKYIKENKTEITSSSHWDKKTVVFMIIDDKLATKCNCKETVSKLCRHQAMILSKISKTNNQFFIFLNSKVQIRFKKKILNKYGLNDINSFDDYFELKISFSKFGYIFKDKAAGLIELDKDEDSIYIKSKLTNDSLSILQPKRLLDNSGFEVGFVFHIDENKKENSLYEIVPIYGKQNKNKTKLINSIKPISEKNNNHNINYADSNKKLINLCNELSQETLSNYFEDIDLDDSLKIEADKYFFLKLKETIPILENNKYLYISTEQIRKTDLYQITISSKPVKLSFLLYDSDDFVHLKAYIADSEGVRYAISKIKDICRLTFFTNIKEKYYLNESLKQSEVINYFSQSGEVKIVKSKLDFLLKNYVFELSKNYPIEIKMQDIKHNTIKLNPQKKQLYISELDNFVLFKPVVEYDNKQEVEILKKGNNIEKKQNIIYSYNRDNEFENEFIEEIKYLHPKFEQQSESDFYHLDIDDLMTDFWFFDAYEKLNKKDIDIYGLKNLKNFKYSPHRAKVDININSGQDWFDIDLKVKFGDFDISLKDVRKAIVNKERYIKLNDGSIGILPEEWTKKFESYFRHGEMDKDNLKISKLKFGLIDELFENIDDTEIIKEIAEKRNRIKNFDKIKNIRKPRGINAKLRDYQKTGLNWLNFLDEFKWGGILADDMGLGKTLQILSFLKHIKRKSKSANLIIVPTTLIFNWENEIKKFAPSFTVLYYHGISRDKDHNNFKNYDIVITTYGLIINDIEILNKYQFNYIILDESQAIKNPVSKRFKAVSLLKSNNKLAMTGTPIENNTFDLFAQMSFLNKGFLGTQNSFKKNYSTPIDKDRDKDRAIELQKLISPFVLRRTKEQVAKELPPKTEDFIFCTMEKEQQQIYDAYRNKYRDYLLNKFESDGFNKSKIHVLEGLLKLRQICDSPALLSDNESYGEQSIKIKELIRHINEKTSNHKILVFSQFVKMLALIKNELVANDIIFEYLDGKSTKKQRENSVNEFQKNDSCRVFLISIKAGGLGLNLTAADYVYIVDPWWNPAVENQAIDRCYRIGQNKKVIAYRMICKNTIEEKIMTYQAKKQQVASDIITTEESYVKQLKQSDIIDLFG